MAASKLQTLQQQLTSAYQLIQRGDIALAIGQLKPLLAKWPQNSDVAHVVALAYKASGDIKSANQYFHRSLSLNAQQPQVLNNLANLYKAEDDFKEAEKYYLKALQLHPKYHDALRNLALCYSEQGLMDQAIESFKQVLIDHPNDVVAINGLADCHRMRSDIDRARQLYNQAISIDANNMRSWYKLGQTNHMDAQLEQALMCYQRAHRLAPEQVAVIQSLASLTFELGETDQAIQLFNQGLALHPDNVDLHQRFNDILWETDYANRFGDSFEVAIRKFPEQLELRTSFINALFKAGQPDRAITQLSIAQEKFGDSAELLSLKGQLNAELGNSEAATTALNKSLALSFSEDAATALIKLSILEERYDVAQSIIAKLFERNPDCQLTWALQSLVWRLTDDPRYRWLNNYDEFVKAYTLQTPDGYDSLDEFLTQLKDLLLKLHKAVNAPLQQTLRNGTQTSARLLHRKETEIVQLKECLRSIAATYIDQLPDDDSHPLLGRKGQGFKFSGSWSVKLQPNGFHVNHVHPAGWISSSCYISVPQSIQDSVDGVEGCIKFGESPLSLGNREVVEKIIKPKSGLVVLFPSYMWHGTYPFSGDDSLYRLTSPFDLEPC